MNSCISLLLVTLVLYEFKYSYVNIINILHYDLFEELLFTLLFNYHLVGATLNILLYVSVFCTDSFTSL